MRTKAEAEAEIERLRKFEAFAWEVNEKLGEITGPSNPMTHEDLAGLLGLLKDSLRATAMAKRQRDLVVRRLHHVIETLDSLDETLALNGVSHSVRVRG